MKIKNLCLKGFLKFIIKSLYYIKIKRPQMKLIVRYCHHWGNVNTFIIDLDEEAQPQELFEKICEKLHLKEYQFISSFKRDGYVVII